MPRAIRNGLWALGASALLSSVLITGSAVPASAYGPDHLYEVTLSYNCMNKTVCANTPFGIGGIWGWLEPDRGTDEAAPGFQNADGQLQFQGHSNVDPALNGSEHSTAVLGYRTLECASASPDPDCFLVAFEGIPTDSSGAYFEFLVKFSGGQTFPVLTPATPGHYGVHPAPGVSATATVTDVS